MPKPFILSTSAMESYRFHLSLTFFLAFFTAQAQNSFYEEKPVKVHPKRIQLVLQMQGNLTPIAIQLNGSALFSESPRKLNLGYEFTLGTNYNDKLEINAGVRRVALYTGYTFRPFSSLSQDGFMTYTTFQSYWQLPIQLKMCLWRLNNSISIWSTVGGAVSKINDGVEFSGGNRVTSVIYSATGAPKTLIENTISNSASSFVSGEVGLAGRWSVTKRIGLDIGVRRHFSKKNLFTFNTKIVDDSGREDNTAGSAGLNAFSYSAGLSIRLNRQALH